MTGFAKISAAAFAAAFALALFSVDPAHAAFRDEGPHVSEATCKQFVDSRLRSPVGYRRMVGFIEGYVAAAREMGKGRAVSPRMAEGHLFEYCYVNPTQSVLSALGRLVDGAPLVAERSGKVEAKARNPFASR